MMDRHFILPILAVAVIGFFGLLWLMPAPVDDGVVRLPWRVSQNAAGQTEVFGFTLGRTTLAEVRAVFDSDGELDLFRAHATVGPEYAAEAFFDDVHLERLRARFVITIAAGQPMLARMYDRGLRISKVSSGDKRIKLTPEDAAALAARPIRMIGYLPKARLDPQLLKRRFGEPAQKIVEEPAGIAHWLYPARGIDIARDPQGRIVIQYVNPDDFAALVAPLNSAAAARSPITDERKGV